MQEKFLQFLIDNNADTWIDQVTDERAAYWRGIDAFMRSNPATDWVQAAFIWDLTKEGYAFWENIHFKWAEVVRRVL